MSDPTTHDRLIAMLQAALDDTARLRDTLDTEREVLRSVRHYADKDMRTLKGVRAKLRAANAQIKELEKFG